MSIPYLTYQPKPKTTTHVRFAVIAKEVFETIIWYEVLLNILEYAILPYARAYVKGPSLFDITTVSEFVDQATLVSKMMVTVFHICITLLQ